MRNVFIIMKKELKRFFTDKRLLLTLFLPGVLIFAIYSVMGNVMQNVMRGDDGYVPKICVINETDEFSEKLSLIGFNYEKKEFSTAEEARTALKENKIDLVVEYEEDFEAKRAAHDGDESLPAPTVKVVGNSTDANSSACAAAVSAALSMASAKVSYNVVNEDAATAEDTSVMIISMILPMILLMLLFSGCMAVVTESIAGEKERGTIATLLITPVKRSHIALGKLLALSVTSLVSSVTSFVGVIASLPKLVGGSVALDLGVYGIGTYAGTFGVVVMTVLIFTVLLSVVSTLAKSVKEASQLALPVMVLALMAGIFSMFVKSDATWQYFVPVFNSAKCLSALFSKKLNAVNLVITLGVNGAFTVLGVFLLARLFNSERVMFNK